MLNKVSVTEKKLGVALSSKVQQLRQTQGLSLDGLAKITGLSKGTVVAIEQGKANPSIGILCRLAVAFSLSVTDLLGNTPEEVSGNTIERLTPVTLWYTPQGSKAVLEASTSGRPMLEMWSWTIFPDDIYHSSAHSRGTHELVSVMQGSLKVTIGTESMILHTGESARLITDQPHSYMAATNHIVSFSMTVYEPGEQS